jgi:hypothetical protein
VEPPEGPGGVTVEPPSVTPTFTPTPTPVTPTITPTFTPVPAINQITSFTHQLFASAMGGQTCRTELSFTVTGDPNGKVELLRNQLVIFTTTVGNRTFTDSFSPGPKSYRVRATNSGGVIQETLQPLNVTPFCLQNFTVSGVLTPPSYAYSWTVQGSGPGTVRIMEDVINNNWTEVGLVPLSPSTFTTDVINEYDNQFVVCNPSQHQIFVTVNGVEVASPIRNLPGLSAGFCTPVP